MAGRRTSSTAPATTPAATPFDTRNIPSLHLRAPGLSGRPRVLWGWGLELHQRIELEARERRVGVVGRPGDEVREVALCADRERIQELVLDADSGPLHVRSGRAEVAEREGRDGGLLPQVLVEAEDRPVALGLGLAESEPAGPAVGV